MIVTNELRWVERNETTFINAVVIEGVEHPEYAVKPCLVLRQKWIESRIVKDHGGWFQEVEETWRDIPVAKEES
jgi:hypothetical protein